MRVNALRLADFRNHGHLALDFRPGTTTIIGRNGRGKTNIVEAVNYLATLGSHRTNSDAVLIRSGSHSATITAEVAKAQRTATVEVTINAAGANRAAINGAAQRRPADVLGLVRCVVFAPEDLELVKGDPAARRRYLDEFATQAAPRVAAVRSEFDRVLKQRSALLKSIGRRPLSETARDSLAAWDTQFVQRGSALVWERLSALSHLEAWITEHGAMISGGVEPLNVQYSAKWLAQPAADAADVASQLTEALAERRAEELDRGMSLVGPHRDDLAISLSDAPAKGYASHGQSWSIALALRLASFSVLRETDDDPVLILDDVFAELDVARRERLLTAVLEAEQTLITAAVAQDVPGELLAQTLTLQD